MTPAIRYQDRDIALLSELGELGLLDTNMIRSRHFPDDQSGKACPKKLRQYKKCGLIETISFPVNYGSGKGIRRRTLRARGHEVAARIS